MTKRAASIIIWLAAKAAVMFKCPEEESEI